MGMAASTGRILAEDGTTVNIADVIGGEHTGEFYDVEKMAPHSGRFVSESGEIINIALAIGQGGGSGGSGGTVSVTATKENGVTTLTINNNGVVKTVEILDGADGKDGAPGTNGKDGQNGLDGADGHTPQRGVDYWTDEDIASIKAYVDAAILGGEW